MPEDPSPETPEEPKPGWFPLPLPKLQAIIGVAAGALTIIVTGGSLLGLSYRAPVQGDLVASVTTARQRTPVRDATVEILTPAAAVITTLSADDDGRIRYRLREGQYRLRVTHPHYLPGQKDFQVWAGQRADVRMTLAPPPPPPPKAVAAPPPKGFFRRFLANDEGVR
jgi:hypothetical protein